jgi:hypothetical protein
MATEEYFPKDIAGKMDHFQEEAAEIILAISKAKRFGLSGAHPDSKETNLQAIHREWKDLIGAFERFEEATGPIDSSVSKIDIFS